MRNIIVINESVGPASVRAAPAARSPALLSAMAVLRLAARFHDLGKAGDMFQSKLDASHERPGEAIADKVRHELISLALWDVIFGRMSDEGLIAAVTTFDPVMIDDAWATIRSRAKRYFTKHYDGRPGNDRGGRPRESAIAADCLASPGIARDVGLLILCHHRLPASTGDHLLSTGEHVSAKDRDGHQVGPRPAEAPAWRDPGFVEAVRSAGRDLRPGPGAPDVILRTALMLGDHHGSSLSEVSGSRPEHAANLRGGAWADSLATHTEKVDRWSREALSTLIEGRFPALTAAETPPAIISPPSDGLYGWQGRAAAEAGRVASDGGAFFACVLAGTGTGKTFGLPAILSAAARSHPDEDERGLRFFLGQGLRSLSSQAASAYVRDVGFPEEAVRVAIGKPLIDVPGDAAGPAGDARSVTGSESADGEQDLVAGGLTFGAAARIAAPWPLDLMLDGPGRDGSPSDGRAAALVAAPIVAGTIDQIAASATPFRSRHLSASARVITSDLVLDEIDQLGPEQLFIVYALIRQAAACGRRVIIASATMPPDVAERAFDAFREGARERSAWLGTEPAIAALVTGDRDGSVFCDPDAKGISGLFEACVAAQTAGETIRPAVPAIFRLRKGWDAIASDVSDICDAQHAVHASDGVSAGLIRVGRIRTAAALAARLGEAPSGVAERKVILLHSRMLAAGRAFIENWLKTALNRKSHPTRNLREALDRAGADPERGVQLIVISSPVIETGNDLDFDYALVDPTDARAVVQTAGRVRRHRRDAPAGPNVVALSPPLQIASGEELLMNPGPESDLPGVEPTRVTDEARKDAAAFLGDLGLDLSPAPILRGDPGCEASDAARRSREAVLQGDVFDPARRSVIARSSRTVLEMRRLRRRTGPSSDIVARPGGADWVAFTEGVKFRFRPLRGPDAPAAALFADPFARSGAEWSDAAASVSVPIGDRETGGLSELAYSPFYGILLPGHDPFSEFGKEPA